ncbi:MAG TPA: adenylyltransferase/cytidyltransferase family protein [Vicinamibacterales bacterium]|nr:adenylyltransferase/cytidyltransferase family protein [Vicinamibacterales bacterium]
MSNQSTVFGRRGRVVFTAGVWDILHVGHLNLLNRAKALGDVLLVGVLTDEAAERYKPRPVMPFEQRIELVKALRMVDDVFAVHDTNATSLIAELEPDILVHGSDISHRPGWEIGQSWMRDNGKQFVVLPYTEGVSSTRLKDAVRARAV